MAAAVAVAPRAAPRSAVASTATARWRGVGRAAAVARGPSSSSRSSSARRGSPSSANDDECETASPSSSSSSSPSAAASEKAAALRAELEDVRARAKRVIARGERLVHRGVELDAAAIRIVRDASGCDDDARALLRAKAKVKGTLSLTTDRAEALARLAEALERAIVALEERAAAEEEEDGGVDGAVVVTFATPGPDGGDDDVAETSVALRAGENVLAAAMRLGVVSRDAASALCLEGRCDGCVMEVVRVDGGDGGGGGAATLRTCQADVGDDELGGRATSAVRLWWDPDGVGDAAFEDGGAWMDEEDDEEDDDDADEEEEVEEAADEDDPFQTGRGVGARGTRAAAEGDAPQDWETFEGSKYYRE